MFDRLKHPVFWLSLVLMLLPVMNVWAEGEGLYFIWRNTLSEEAIRSGEGTLRYWDDTRFLADLSGDEAARLTERGADPRLVSAEPPGSGYLLIMPRIDEAESVVSAPLSARLDAGGLWLVPETPVTAEDLIRSGRTFSHLPRGPLPLPEPAPTADEPRIVAGGELGGVLEQLSAASLSNITYRLEGFQTRYTHTDSVYAAAAWIGDQFLEYGFTEVAFDSFYITALPEDRLCINVVAVKPGEVHPDRQVVVGGHYDSTVLLGRPREYAPGADDNGSGTAATLELARVLAPIPLDYTVVFIAFAAEEQGLRGSWHYASDAYTRGDDIRLMINMDMIAYLEDEIWDVNILTNGSSQSFANLMADMAEAYTPLLPVIGSASGNSDHWPFMQYGYHAVVGHEGDFNNCWHKQCDTADRLAYDYMLEVTRMVGATAVSVAGPTGATAIGGETQGTLPVFGPSLSIHPLPGPGPFVLSYELSGPGPWELEVFDIRGRRMLVRDLPATAQVSGEFQWDGRSPDGSPVSAGVYWVRLRGPVGAVTERLVVVH